MEIKRLVTTNEAAELSRQLNLGLSKNFIRTLVKTNQVKYHMVGNKKALIVWSSLMEYLENPPELRASITTGIRPVPERLVG